MTVNLSMLAGAGAQFFDNNGVILSGGLVYTYAAGTTTPQATYTTSSGSTAHTNPIVLDSAGRVPSGGEIWLTDSVAYKFVLKTSAAVTIGTYDNVPGNASGIYATFAASSGSSLVGYTQGGAGAVPTTVQAKLRESVSVNDFLSSSDATTATQAALNAASQIVFLAGQTYNLTADIQIPANRKIIVEKNATVINTGGRFTAYDVDNVEWQIDGVVRSVAMATAPAKTGWPSPSNPNITDIGNCRGFIEFGSATYNSPRTGFTVSGSGTVSGDWTGTPATVSAIDINFRGIVIFTGSNVLVNIREVYGFRAEAVHTTAVSTNCINVKFQGIYSHDNKFDNINFNFIGPYLGCEISDCLSVNGYIGIEASGGSVINNVIINPLISGVYFGQGYASDFVEVTNNTVFGAGQISYNLVFVSSSPSKTIVHGNKSYSPGQNAYLIGLCNGLSMKNNHSVGHATTSAGYAYNYGNCQYAVIDGNDTLLPGSFSSGTRVLTSCSDATVGLEYTTTNSSATPVIADGKKYAWTPVPTNLTIVNVSGAPVYDGYYSRISDVVFWEMTITCPGTTTTAATVSSTTFAGLPVSATVPSTVNAATEAIAQLQNGVLIGSTIYTPTWSATSAIVVLSGTFLI